MLSVLEYFNCPDPIWQNCNTKTVIVVSVLSATFFYGIHKINQRKYIPTRGPPYIPFIGTFPFFRFNGTFPETISDLLEKYNTPILYLKIPFMHPVYIIGNYEIAKKILILNAHSSKARQPDFYAGLHPLKNGLGIVCANGRQWETMRKLALNILRDHGLGKEVLEMKVQAEAETLGEVLEDLSSKLPEGVNPRNCFENASASIICQIVFGEKFSYDDPEFIDLMENSHLIFESTVMKARSAKHIFKRFIHNLGLKNDIDYQKAINHGRAMHDFYAKQIQSHKARFDPNSISDMIDAFLLQQLKGTDTKEFTNDSLLQLIDDMFLAGTDTTSSTLLWCILLINKFPVWLTKCRDELDRVVGRSRLPRYRDHLNLPMVMATIMECQRYSGAISGILPHMADRDIVIEGVCTISKGADIGYCSFPVFRRKSLWPKPDEFDPEANFLDNNGMLRKPEHFVPFSMGPRKCPGIKLAKLELFIFFSHLVHLYNMKLDPMTEIKRVQHLTVLPGKYYISFSKRID